MAEGPISIAVAVLENLLTRPADHSEIVPLRVSPDVGSGSWEPGEMEQLEEEFAAFYRETVAEITAAWGPPSFAGSFEHPAFPVWCPGTEVSCWRRGDRLACVWRTHRELPVAVEVYVTPLEHSGSK